MLDIERALKDVNLRIILTHTPSSGYSGKNNNFSVVGINEQDFSLSAAGAYDHHDSDSTGNLQKKLNAVTSALGTGEFQLKNLRKTISEWCGNSKQPLNIPITVMNYDGSTNPINVGKNLLMLSSPHQKGGDYGVMEAPGGYSPQSLQTQFMTASCQGTWSIQIGKWFRANNFLLTAVSVSHSREIIKSSGVPLFVRCNCTFTPYILPSSEIIESWYML